MAITRRLLLQRSAAALAGTMVPMQIWANTTLTIGPIQIDTLSDGNLMLPRNFQFGELAPSDIDPILEKYGITGDQIMPDCNVTLLRDGTNTVLFDAGSGTEFMPSAGKLPDALDAIGLAPEDVTHVVFTHAHPDHLWGVLDDFNDPYFPNASYLIGQTEFDFALPLRLGPKGALRRSATSLHSSPTARKSCPGSPHAQALGTHPDT
jgi:glyoxylase-like metal-dependent hydrolase (beta-lactamase superfamily II)